MIYSNKLFLKSNCMVIYPLILALAMIIMMIRPLLVAYLLNQSEFASYSTGLLISSTFCMLGCLGLQTVIQKQMPIDLHLGNNNKSLILLIQGILIAILCLFIGGSICFFSPMLLTLGPLGIFVGIINGFSQQVFLLATIESRSVGKYVIFSLQNLFRAFLVILTTLFVAYFIGSAIVTLLVESLVTIIISYGILYRIFNHYDISILNTVVEAMKKILSINWESSLALMLIMILAFALTNIDRWLVVISLSPKAFANYAMAGIILLGAQSLQVIINSAVFPSLAKMYATGNKKHTFAFAKKNSIYFLLIGVAGSVPGFFLIKQIILYIYPNYYGAILIIPILIFVAILRMSDFWSSYLIVVGEEKILLLIDIAMIVVSLIIWYTITIFISDISIYSIASFAVAIGFLRYFMVMIIAILRS